MSFVDESKRQAWQFQDKLLWNMLPFFPPDMSEPLVTDITDIKVYAMVSGGDTQDDNVEQSLILAVTAERCLHEA